MRSTVHAEGLIETPAMIVSIRGTDLAIGVAESGTTTLGVRDGTATATPAIEGTAVEVTTGQTATPKVVDRSVDVSNGLVLASAGAMLGGSLDADSGGRSSGGDGGGHDRYKLGQLE